jgi:hypothetical protein
LMDGVERGTDGWPSGGFEPVGCERLLGNHAGG